jgi:superfamily II DNA/RNA helicase
VAPTRELAEQIHDAIGVLGKKTGLRSISIYGGVAIGPQIKSGKKADIIVACPGRLLDHIGRKTVRSFEPLKCWFSTKPITCSTWVFCPISAAS